MSASVPPCIADGDSLDGAGNSDSRREANMIHVSQKIGIARTGDLVWRAPSPPHIHIPQYADGNAITLPSKNGFLSSDDPSKQILRELTDSAGLVAAASDWEYEWRRRGQRILSFLYLGPSAAARDMEFVKKEGITMLLAIRDTATAQARLLSSEKISNQLGIAAFSIDVTGHTGLIRAFPRATKIINDHILSIHHDSNGSQIGKALVFCESGNERSAAVVAAYLMDIYGLDFIHAIQYLQSQRFCISFDDEMKNLLYSYMEILDAQRQVTLASPDVTTFECWPKCSEKRRREGSVDRDLDVDMGCENDVARFGGRQAFAPFR